jgi:PAS domain-containing protein
LLEVYANLLAIPIEQHVKLLHQMNQPVPQSVALLLADARRKQDKRMTKRLANRKSACTSRARKKTLVDEMTKTNARLRRQAMILALLPDLVIAINLEGDITFCSAQVERVLRHNTDDLIGAKLHQLLVPASRGALDSLIKELVKADKKESQATPRGSKRRRADQQNSSDTMSASKTTEDNGNGGSSRSGVRSGGNASAAAVVSVQSFPLSVQVRVNKLNENNVNSDGSTSNGGGKQPAVSSNSTALSRSPTASSSGEDEGARAERAAKSKRLSSSDESSSLSSEVKNMRNANQNLDRNVRWHNQKMMKMHGAKDDVTGASVTANTATARLSSLQHVPAVINKRKEDSASRYENTGDQSSSDDSLLAGVEEKKKGEHASDDSGYRESNDSREETSSSGSDTFNSKGKKVQAVLHRLVVILYFIQ